MIINGTISEEIFVSELANILHCEQDYNMASFLGRVSFIFTFFFG